MKTFSSCVTSVVAIMVCTECQADWNSTIAESNPLNWYRFDELTGNIAVDYGNEHRNGMYGSGALDAQRGVDGRVGVAAQFENQSTVFLSAPDIVGDWSAEFVLMRTGEKRSSILIRGIPFAFPSVALKLEQYFNTHEVGYTKFGIVDATFNPPVTSPLNDWIHLVYVNHASEDRVRLYVDGTPTATRIDNFNLSRDQIGSWSDTVPESPLAIIDEVVLYNRALSAAEIADHFAAIPEPSSFVLCVLVLMSMKISLRVPRCPYTTSP